MTAHAEWIESDGLGGFASGRSDGIRSRRYHALLLVATTPPTRRVSLVSGFEAWVETDEGREAISSHRYAPDVVYPDGATRLLNWKPDPWPTWRYRLATGAEVIHELIVPHDQPRVLLSWTLVPPASRGRLYVRPFISARDIHALQRENPELDLGGTVEGSHVRWRPDAAMPAIVAASNGNYRPAPLWFRQFRYEEETSRGLDDVEDLASPGEFSFDLANGRAVLDLRADLSMVTAWGAGERVPVLATEDPSNRTWNRLAAVESARRARFVGVLERAADDFIVRRGNGRTIIAGYPWFADWGRDTFIALRGLCIAGRRLADARSILLEWAGHVSQGMLPNMFPEDGEPRYNSVDASLWYIIAADAFLSTEAGRSLAPADRETLHAAIDGIVDGYARGTRYGIGAEPTGLLRAGVQGVQLTWMDAKVDDWVVTPRIGKPVEIQALWINALRIAGARSVDRAAMATRACVEFERRFWSDASGHLHDVVDVNHVAGTADPSFRPNQLFAVGGLPWTLLDGDRARRLVDACERRLWTPAGPRSLAPDEPGYVGRYVGDPRVRDGAYHQGTVWPWLAGAFIEAWVRVRGSTAEAKTEAYDRFLRPMLAHYRRFALGHIAEIADAEPPHAPRGCPFQAWSLAEVLRLSKDVLGRS